MSVVVSIDVTEIQQLARFYARLGDKGMFPPMRRAVNKVGAKVYTQVVRLLAKETGAQQKRIRKVFKKRPATHNLEWRATMRDQYMSLKDFRPKQTKAGVRHDAWGGGTIKHAFIVPSLGGHVFFRQGPPRPMKSGRYKGKKRQPLEKLWGPALPVQLIRGATGALVAKMSETDLVPEILRQAVREIDIVAGKTLKRGRRA